MKACQTCHVWNDQAYPFCFRVFNSDFSAVALVWAFGHFCLKDFGLIAVPDVSRHHLTGKDEFVVLATDGVVP